jgi:type II secretory pathway component PulC
MMTPNEGWLRNRLHALLSQRAAAVSAFGLAVLIVLQVLNFAYSWRSATPLARRPARVAPGATAGSGTYAAQIARAALFGAAPSSAPLDEANAQPATSGYVLKGILATDKQDGGEAIIAGPDGHSGLYASGKAVAAGVIVQKVAFDYVLLATGTRLERLTLWPTTPAHRTRPRREQMEPAHTAASRTTLTADTRSTLGILGLNLVGDEADGITGISGQGSPAWQHSGLRPTDVIVAIDGAPVAHVLGIPQGIDTASVAAVTTLTVLRDGAQMDITATQDPAPEPPALTRRRHRT